MKLTPMISATLDFSTQQQVAIELEILKQQHSTKKGKKKSNTSHRSVAAKANNGMEIHQKYINQQYLQVN